MRSGTNVLAVASLVLGILWLCGIGSLLAVIFGIIALSQLSKQPQGGRGLAIAGIVLGTIGIVGTISGTVLLARGAEELTSIANQQEDERNDVEIVRCEAVDGRAVVTVEITNDSSKPSNYFITIEMSDGNTTESTTFTVGSVEPDQTWWRRPSGSRATSPTPRATCIRPAWIAGDWRAPSRATRRPTQERGGNPHLGWQVAPGPLTPAVRTFDSDLEEDDRVLRLARMCFRHPWRWIGAWFVAVVVAVAAAGVWGGQFADGGSLPGTDSQAAYDLLASAAPDSTTENAQLVLYRPEGFDPSMQDAVRRGVADLATVPGVVSISDPFARVIAPWTARRPTPTSSWRRRRGPTSNASAPS
ncbi:MAG: DUF4190 domain-containing protein [Ilumatobacteraceae bacterium]